MRARFLSFLRPSTTAIAVVALVVAAVDLAVPASGAPVVSGRSERVTITNLSGATAESFVPTPGQADVPLVLAPAASTSFTQKAGQVILMTGTPHFSGAALQNTFCDMTLAVRTGTTGSGPQDKGVDFTFPAQRGGIQDMDNHTKAFPALSTDTTRTLSAFVSLSPLEQDLQTCFPYGGEGAVSVGVDLSIVTIG